jgi:dienelactone hydrolase
MARHESRAKASSIALRFFGCIAFAALLGGYYASRPADFATDVVASDVLIASPIGTLNARLYRPASPTSAVMRPPGVVLNHGYAANLTMLERPFALALARHGLVVLAVDYAGHGTSEGGIRFRRRTDAGDYDVPDIVVETAVEFLATSEAAASSKIGLVGHSDGAKAAASVALRDRRVWGSVFISGPQDIALYSRDDLRNAMFLYGADDRFTPPTPPRSLEQSWLQHPGVPSGDFDAGSARVLSIVPDAGHLSVLYSERARSQVLAWLMQSLDWDGPAPRVEPIVLQPLFAGYLGAILTVAMLSVLGQRLLGSDSVGSAPKDPTIRRTRDVVRSIGQLVILGVAVFLSARSLPKVVPSFEWIGVSGGALLFASIASTTIAFGTSALLAYGVALVEPAGDEVRGAVVTTDGRDAPREIVVGMVCAVLLIAAVTRLSEPYFDPVLTLRRFTLLAVVLVVLTPMFLLWELWTTLCTPRAWSGTAVRWLARGASAATAAGAYAYGAMSSVQGAQSMFVAVFCVILWLGALMAPAPERRLSLTSVSFGSATAGWLVAVLCPFH